MRRCKIYLIPAAHADLVEARSWYRQINLELSKRMTLHVKTAIDKLRTFPTTYAIRYQNVRISNLPVFPYPIHFTIENPKKVVIIGIHHTAVDPGKWIKRLEKDK